MEAVLEKYGSYEENELNVFKTCGKYMLILQKYPEYTITNEDRHVFDNKYATFRADCLIVILIFNKSKPEETIDIFHHSNDGHTTTYRINELVYSDSFDENLNNVCSLGIDYVKSLEAAFYRNLHETYALYKFHCEFIQYNKKPYSGKFNKWFPSGQKCIETSYLDGQLHGPFIQWTLWNYKTTEYFNHGHVI
jgi:hypothetical protein